MSCKGRINFQLHYMWRKNKTISHHSYSANNTYLYAQATYINCNLKVNKFYLTLLYKTTSMQMKGNKRGRERHKTIWCPHVRIMPSLWVLFPRPKATETWDQALEWQVVPPTCGRNVGLSRRGDAGTLALSLTTTSTGTSTRSTEGNKRITY